MEAVEELDLSSWRVTLLPHPARCSFSGALGFCGGHAVGTAQTARGKGVSCWWPEGEPELLELDGFKEVVVLAAAADGIAGKAVKGAKSSAAVWRLKDGDLVGSAVHPKAFESSWATWATRDLALGVGVPKGGLGKRGPDRGLVFRDDGSHVEVAAAGDVVLRATDGERLVGSVEGRAALWPTFASAPIDLHPAGCYSSEVAACDGEAVAGVAFRGTKARAALWGGSSSSSFVDLTPEGFQVGHVLAAAHGFQVGAVRDTDVTGSGMASLADRAALWRGTAGSFVDLNALLPPESGLQASKAYGLERQGDRLVVCGEASRFEVSDAGTDRESHVQPERQAVVWSVQIRSLRP